MPQKKELLDLALNELKRVNDKLNVDYNQAKVKIIPFLGAGLATLTYLYREPGVLFFPDEMYGMIFYCVGLGLMIASLVLLFIALLPIGWYYPTELKDLKRLDFKNEPEMLAYVRDEYIAAISENIASYEKKQQLLSISTYMLIIGAIILVVLKQFGGQ